MPIEDDERTDAQKEWADWAAHGYRKLYQPRSMLWFGGIFFLVFAIGLVVVFWLASGGRWP
jgi:membrane-anchored protein YejM (alkaline phosphatase superfamily)